MGREAKTDISHDCHSAGHLSIYDACVHSQKAVTPAMFGASHSNTGPGQQFLCYLHLARACYLCFARPLSPATLSKEQALPSLPILAMQVEQTWAMPNILWAPWSFSIFFDMSNCLSSTPCLAETERSPAGRNAKAWSVHPETATPWSLVSTRWNLSKNTNTTTPENKPPRQPMSRRHPAPDPGSGQPDVRGTCRPNATAPTAQTKETHGGTCRPTVEGVYHF